MKVRLSRWINGTKNLGVDDTFLGASSDYKAAKFLYYEILELDVTY